jgi:hypothetical protein
VAWPDNMPTVVTKSIMIHNKTLSRQLQTTCNFNGVNIF